MNVKSRQIAARSSATTPPLKAQARYGSLVKAVRTRMDGLEGLVRRKTAEVYWQVGHDIHVHLLENEDRADHGSGFFTRLAEDTGRDASTLLKMVRFFRTYPNLAPGPDLNWGHYRVLMAVKDDKERKRLEKTSITRGWDTRQLQEHLRERREIEAVKKKDTPPPRLDVVRGRPGIYQVVVSTARGKPSGELLIDYGFGVKRPLTGGGRTKLSAGDLVTIKDGRCVRIDAAEVERYTYKAHIERVVDGDTLLVLIEGGGGNFITERLRLRGLDAPPLKTKAGRKAEQFISRVVGECPFIILRTHKERRDMYARYITDVFYLPGKHDADAVAANGLYLNQELLDNHLAAPYGI